MHGGGRSDGVFISYRRASSTYVAMLLRDRLARQGFDVFLDLESLDNGRFEKVILDEIAGRAHFVVLIDPETRLGGPAPTTTWMQREIARALGCGVNVVPVMLDGARFDDLALPTDIADLADHNAVVFSHDYLDASVEKVARFLGPTRPPRNRPRLLSTFRTAAAAVLRRWWRRPWLASAVALGLVVALAAGVTVYLRTPTVITTTSSPETLALSPLGDRLYAAGRALLSEERDAFSVIDTATETETAALALRSRPGDVALSFDGRVAYVPVGVASNIDNPAGSLAVIDTDGPRLRTEVPLPTTASGAIAVSRDGRRVYVGLVSGSVAVVDPTSGRIVTVGPPLARIGREQRMVLTPDGGRLLLVGHAGSAALTPDGRYGDTTPAVWVLDTTTLTPTTTLPLGRVGYAYPTDIALSADGSRAYVAEGYGGSVWVLDTTRAALVATIPLMRDFASTYSIAVGKDGQPVTASSQVGGPSVLSFLGPRSVLGTVETDAETPDDIVSSRNGESVYVANYDGVHVVGLSGYTPA